MKCQYCGVQEQLRPGQTCDECKVEFPETFADYLFRLYVGIGKWLDFHRITPVTEEVFNELSEVWVGFQNAQTIEEVIALATWANHLEHYTGMMWQDYYLLPLECVDMVSKGIGGVYPNLIDEVSDFLDDNWFANTHLYRPISFKQWETSSKQ